MPRRQQADSCGFGSAMAVIGGKWKATILWEVHDGPRRFGELKRCIAGISEKILIEQLRQMEADGLLCRRSFDGKVLHVEYSVTPLGLSLNDAVHAMAEWGRAYAARPVTSRG